MAIFVVKNLTSGKLFLPPPLSSLGPLEAHGVRTYNLRATEMDTGPVADLQRRGLVRITPASDPASPASLELVPEQLALRPGVASLAYAATILVDFDPALSFYRSVVLTGDATLASTNLDPDRSLTVRFQATGAPRTLTVPVAWNRIGGTGALEVPAGLNALLSATSFGTTDADVLYSFVAQS